MVTELSEAFLYAQSTYVVWKEIVERQISNARREVRHPRVDTRTDQKRSCSHCRQEGHVFEQCFERIGYPDKYKGKKEKKSARITAHVNFGFEEMVSGETLFDLGNKNKIGMGQNGSIDQRLVAAVCSEIMKIFKGKWIADDNNDPIMVHLPDGRSLKVTIVGEVALTPSLILCDDLTTKEIMAVGKGSRFLYICKPMTNQTSFAASIAEFHESYKLLVPNSVFNKTAFSNVVNTNSSLNIHIFNARLGHTSVSKRIHIPECKQFDVSKFHCESCMLSKHHRLPIPVSTSIQSVSFTLLHMDFWGPYKPSALNEAHYFFIIMDDRTRATWTYLVNSKDQIPTLLVTFLAYVDNHFKARPKFINTHNGT
nr:hypothetical protein [Tanacetum cinerariifolium]